MRKGLLFFWFLLLSATVMAQEFAFKNYTTHDGLVQTDITDIKQDAKGNIWIGTNGGISIFDGRNFTNYDDHDLLQSLRINALLCDSDGIMWIATRNGLLKYEKGFEVVFKPNAGHDNGVSCLTSNSQNQVLFVCNNQVYQIRKKQIEKYPLKKELQKDVMFVAFDRDDNLWIVTNNLSIYKKTFNQYTQIRTPFTEKERRMGLGVVRLLGKEGPVPYIVTNFGTFWVRGDSLHYFIEQYPSFGKARVGSSTYILERDDSTIWVGGTVGFSKISENTFGRFSKDNGFCDNSVSCLFTDKEHNLWIGCTYNGVYKLSNESLFHLQSNESVDLKHVMDMKPISPNKTLIGTWGKGLYVFNGDSTVKVKLPHPSIRYITSLLPVGDHTYISWFGNGIWKLNNQTLEAKPVPGFATDEAVDRMYRLRSNLLVQTLSGVCYLTDENFRVKASVKLPEDHTVLVLKDRIYRISSFGQVDELNNQLQAAQKNIFPDISSRITDITCFRDYFLIGTFGQGLFMYDQRGKLVKKLDKKNGLNTNIVTSLLVDGNRLFIGSNLGLIQTELPEAHYCKVFNESEGMFNWECRQGGVKKLANGSIMIATTNGPYVYYPNNDLSSQFTSGTLSIADFRYGENSEKQLPSSFLLSAVAVPNPIAYKDNQVVVTLKGVSQRNPREILYHYQLAGYDSMWIATVNPVVKFPALSPGEYVFKAYLTVGNFTSKPVSVKFTIDKPLSGKLWFQVLLLLALSFAGWLLLSIGNRIYQKYIQSRMVGKMETDIATKQQLTAQSISFAQNNYRELSEALKNVSPENYRSSLTPIFLKDLSKRIELLWSKHDLTIGEIHRYYDDLLSDDGASASIYHKSSLEDAKIPMTAAYSVLQVFSIYLFVGLYENGTSVFSLDSGVKSNRQLLLRFYKVNREHSAAKISTYHFIKEAIGDQKMDGVTIDVIENLEFGNMLIAEVNLHNEFKL